MAFIRDLISITILVICASSAAFAEKRVALVIGNGAYANAPTLANPRNDAADMAAALRALGFTVIVGTDLTKTQMDRKILEFASALSGADAGVFHYSGHGLQVAGVNYLVPVDAELTTAAALDFEMVRLDLVQRTVEREAKTNILFLDACRNNPIARNLARALGTRSTDIGRGLASMESGAGTLISFSTQPGNVALDGEGRNSPYSGPLIKAIGTPGEDVLVMLREVRNAVMAATGDRQVPWDNNALRASFYFNPTASSGLKASRDEPRSPMSEVAQRWSEIKDSTDVSLIEAFREQYGKQNPLYDRLASQRAAALKPAEGGGTSSWWPWSSGAKPEPAKTPETQTAAVAPEPASAVPRRLVITPIVVPSGNGLPYPFGNATPAPAAQPQSTASCDGLLVSVAMGTSPCIKPGLGESFKDCPECPEMVVLPAGSFMMGSPESEAQRSGNEGPQRRVAIPKPFAVGRFAVTFKEWDACVADGGCGGYKPEDRGWGRGDRPVINVNWDDAKGFTAWLSQKTGQRYRLLSEAEREYAGRAGSTTPFWWGSSITPEQANYNGNYTYGAGAKGDYRAKTVPVKSFKPNLWGLYQVHGNVYDWVEDCCLLCYQDSYNGARDGMSEWTTGECKHRVLRGGFWGSGPESLRSAYRYDNDPGDRRDGIGFRVARTLNP